MRDGKLKRFVGLWQLDFEPEYAMENFSDNPDIDDTPQISLEETMARVKPYLMRDDITEEMWEV